MARFPSLFRSRISQKRPPVTPRLFSSRMLVNCALLLSGCTPTEYLGLASLYDAAGGKQWVHPTLNTQGTWLSTEPCCTWPGVHCNKMDEVKKIKLSEFSGVRGTIPENLLFIPTLKEIDFSRCEHSTPPVSHFFSNTLRIP